VTLIELLLALVTSAILIAGIYRTFLTQSHTFAVQDQVVETQQNVRVAINQMMREIRTTGSGNIRSVVNPQSSITINGKTYTQVVNPDNPETGALTILTSAYGPSALVKSRNGAREIEVDQAASFDTANNSYISIGGTACYKITEIANGTGSNKKLTVDRDITLDLTPDLTPVYPVRALTYRVVNDGGKSILRRVENIGMGTSGEDLAENIENLTFQFLDANGTDVKATPENTRSINVTVTARTEKADPQMKDGDGYRRRTVSSNLTLRNMGL